MTNKHYEREVLAEVAKQRRRFGWGKKGVFLFAERQHFFVSASVGVNFTKDLLAAHVSIKPLAIDTAHWKILGLEENEKKSLSFRIFAAFGCSALPMGEVCIKRNGESVSALVEKLLGELEESVQQLTVTLAEKSFADEVKAHPNHRARGAYAITLIASLIAENRNSEALAFAKKFDSGELRSVSSQIIGDKSSHAMAVEWIERRTDR